MSKSITRGEIQDLVGKFASENPEYRSALVNDPKGVIEKQLNASLPAGVTVKAVVETADTAYVVVPHVAGEGELNDADLEKVAGGRHNKDEEGGLIGIDVGPIGSAEIIDPVHRPTIIDPSY